MQYHPGGDWSARWGAPTENLSLNELALFWVDDFPNFVFDGDMFKNIVSRRGRAKKNPPSPDFWTRGILLATCAAQLFELCFYRCDPPKPCDVCVSGTASGIRTRKTHHLEVVLVAWNEFMCGSKTRDVLRWQTWELDEHFLKMDEENDVPYMTVVYACSKGYNDPICMLIWLSTSEEVLRHGEVWRTRYFFPVSARFCCSLQGCTTCSEISGVN